MKEKLIDLLAKGKGLEVHQITAAIPNDSLTEIMKAIHALMEEGIIIEDEEHFYHLLENSPYRIGTLRLHERGFGFVDIDDGGESIYIHQNHLHQAMAKDEVLIRIWTYPDGSKEGEVIRIMKRAVQKLVGTYKKKKGAGYFLADTNLHGRKIRLLNEDAFHLVHDHKLLVEIVHFNEVLEANILQILGYKYDPGIDILSILLTHDIEPRFPDAVMKEVQQIPKQVEAQDLLGRRDLRNELIITIDGDDARDLDDAISVKKETGGYRLGVHIADVSHYVKAHSAIDEEAYQRGTSVYVTDRVVPMLPQALSNGICSLLPQSDRLTLTCEMLIDEEGTICEYQLYPSVIRSAAQMTYRKVNAILAGDRKMQKRYEWLLGMLKDMYRLAQIIRKARVKQGTIDFDVKEGKVLVDDQGDPYDVIVRERGEAERIIEDFMIQANSCVAAHNRWLDLPSMYRVHEPPELKKMRAFQQTATIMGHKLKGNLADLHPMRLQTYLDALKGKEDYDVIAALLLRSMQKARYDVECKGHFGLALTDYTHFTSPIRRYPDLIVHRNLRKYFFAENYQVQEMQNEEAWIEACALQCSKKERNAIEAEREVDDFKKAQYMESHIGAIYTGHIRSIMKFGMFVELDNTVEGLVHITSMNDDYYIFDEAGRSFYGTHTKKTYRMGQRVTIKVIDASRYKQQVDFILLEEEGNEKKNKGAVFNAHHGAVHERMRKRGTKRKRRRERTPEAKRNNRKRRYQDFAGGSR